MIYFVQSPDGGPVKIGYSADVPTRVKQLEADYKRPLALLATMPGEVKDERAVHERFSHLRFGKTEQFRPAPDLMEFIGRPLLVSPNPEATEVMKSSAGVLVRVSDGLADALRKCASLEGCSVAEFADRWLMPEVHRVYKEQIAKESKRLEGR